MALERDWIRPSLPSHLSLSFARHERRPTAVQQHQKHNRKKMLKWKITYTQLKMRGNYAFFEFRELFFSAFFAAVAAAFSSL